VSRGTLVVTNRRFVFLGDKKSFNSRLDKLLAVQLFGDGLRVDDSAGKPHNFVFESADVEVFGAVLSHAINADSEPDGNPSASTQKRLTD
jgi:hypothetical protein